jgi:UDP-GlcNAc:undecaprenyl-phosphate/decaprenyl-phosphate GlcNAc-1-phosphate transferase
MHIRTALALILTFALAFAITALLVPPVQRLCERRGWLALPGGRRTHARPTPNVGGIAIYLGFVLTLLGTFVLGTIDPALQRSPMEMLRLGLLLLGSTVLFLVMWRDDVVELPPLPKFIAQALAGLIAVGPYLWDHTRYPDVLGDLTEARGIVLTAFKFPFISQVSLWDYSPWLAIGATVLWLGWMSNTINWSDGLDGMVAGISLIAALMLAIHAWRLGQLTIALLPLTLAGTCAGFLLFNFPPARIFMGDSGAEVLGYLLGVCAIIGGAKLATVLLVLGVPILDFAWLIISRTFSGRSPTQGGRDHLHLRLRDLGFSNRQIVLFYYSLGTAFGLVGISEADQRLKLAALVVLALIVAAVIVYVGRRGALAAR